MKRTLLFTACASLLGVGIVAATPINGATSGLASPDSTITFDEHVYASGTSITNEYADLGVTFAPNTYYDPEEGFGLDGKTIGNFGNGPTVDPMTTMSFGGTRSGVAFQMAADVTDYTFTAWLGGVAQESFTTNVGFGATAFWYGFEGISFDQLTISRNDAGGGPFWLVDNLQQQGSTVPEPASLVLLGSGLFLAGRRRWQARA